MTTEEIKDQREALEEELHAIGAERAEAERGYKERMQAVAAELERLNDEEKVAKMVTNLTPDQLRMLKAIKVSDLGVGVDGPDEGEES